MGHPLFDGKLAILAILADSFVDSAVGTTADEAHDMVSVTDMDLAGIAGSSSRI